MPSINPDPGPGGPEQFTDMLSPEMAALVPAVAEGISNVEAYDISTIRVDAERALIQAEVMNYFPVDVSRIALAARLHRMAHGQ